MTEPEKNYSDYLQHASNVLTFSALVTGFILTVITLLLTLLPYMFLSSLVGQSTLFFLTALFNLWLNFGAVTAMWGFRLAKDIPPMTWEIRYMNINYRIAIFGFGFLLPILYLFWNFLLLALISTAVWLVFYSVILSIHRTGLRLRRPKGN
ncbi:MAG: hypothetical protein ACXACH_01505 [Candidatus Hermodarchaeia archaeon]|jgi:hypothetical protein